VQELEALYGDLARLYRYIARLTGNEQLMQDILQETFLKAAEHLLVSSDILKPAWFYTVARNCYLAMLVAGANRFLSPRWIQATPTQKTRRKAPGRTARNDVQYERC